MEPPPITAATIAYIQEQMLSQLSEDEFAPAESSAEGLVTVKIDAHFQLRSVAISEKLLSNDDAAQLEQALITAMNAAIQEVARRNGERFAQLLKVGKEQS
jgi:DNA-binding protein YbaB